MGNKLEKYQFQVGNKLKEKYQFQMGNKLEKNISLKWETNWKNISFK